MHFINKPNVKEGLEGNLLQQKQNLLIICLHGQYDTDVPLGHLKICII